MIRYEFNGTGMFHSLPLLEDCDMERADAEELEKIEYIFENELPHPDVEWDKNTKCWFKEEGDARFAFELESLQELFRIYLEYAGLGTLTIKEDDPVGDIIYEDAWQVVVRTVSS